jgi:hypothetical protein
MASLCRFIGARGCSVDGISPAITLVFVGGIREVNELRIG